MSEHHWFDDLQDEEFLSWASTFEELEESGCDTALFCIGAIEQHSYHMPLGTDWLLGLAGSRLLARELAQRGLIVYLLPPIPIGTSSEFLNYKGTLSLKPNTVAAILEDTAACLKRQGFKRMIVTSSHGGNWILKPTIRELNMWDPDFLVMWGAPVGAGGSGPGKDRHSGESETSRLMYAYPELMRTEKVVDSSPDLGSEYVDMIPTEYYTPSGVWGFPTKADRDAGEERTQRGVASQADYIIETIAKLDEMRREHEQG